jgi:hypothetical protein
MATYNSDILAQNNVRVGAHIGISPIMKFANVTLATAVTTADTINMFVAPKGFRVFGATLVSSDMDTNGSPTIALNVGDAGSATRFFSASNVAQAGTASTATATTGLGFLFTADTVVTITPSANPATFAAGTVQLLMWGRYEGTAS